MLLWCGHDGPRDPSVAPQATTHTEGSQRCIGSLSLCDSNARTEGKRFRDHHVRTVRWRVWRWSTHLELCSSVLRGKKPGKGLGLPGTIAHSRCSTKRRLPPLLSVQCCRVSTVTRYS